MKALGMPDRDPCPPESSLDEVDDIQVGEIAGPLLFAVGHSIALRFVLFLAEAREGRRSGENRTSARLLRPERRLTSLTFGADRLPAGRRRFRPLGPFKFPQ
jgi:hypothetical protein